MPKISRKRAEELARAAFDGIFDRLYEPWEWNDMESLPAGYTAWSTEAVEAYSEGLIKKMADAIMRAGR